MISIPTTLSEFASVPPSHCNGILELTGRYGRQARGDEEHNIVAVTMNELGLSLQEAYDWVGRYHDGLANEFLDLHRNLPLFPDLSETTNWEIREYVDGLGNWVRTNESWSFEV